MAQTYTVSDLNLADPTSSNWALAWARFIAKDTPINSMWPEYSITDEEWTALLDITAVAFDSNYDVVKETYYFPVEAVITKVVSDPTFAQSISEDGYSTTYRDPAVITTFLRATYGAKLAQYYPTHLHLDRFTLSLNPRF